MEASYKAAKGLIRIKATVDGEKIKDIQIAGDFFMYPEDRLWELERNCEPCPEVNGAKVQSNWPFQTAPL